MPQDTLEYKIIRTEKELEYYTARMIEYLEYIKLCLGNENFGDAAKWLDSAQDTMRNLYTANHILQTLRELERVTA